LRNNCKKPGYRVGRKALVLAIGFPEIRHQSVKLTTHYEHSEELKKKQKAHISASLCFIRGA